MNSPKPTPPPRGKRPAPKVSIEVITPERAQELLKLNLNNRKINHDDLRKNMHAMANRRWLNDGNPIRISWDNVLLDGQHRLLAAVDTATSIESVMVTGLDPACSATIDGGKPRTATDAATISGIAAPGRKSAFARRVLLWESPKGIGSNASFTNSQIVDWLMDHVTEVNEMYSHARPSIQATKMRQGSTYDLLFWLFCKVSPEKAIGFFEELASGVDRPEGSPFISLEKAIHRKVKTLEPRANGVMVERVVDATASNGPGRVRLVSLVIKAWNMWISGEKSTPNAMVQPAEIPEIRGIS